MFDFLKRKPKEEKQSMGHITALTDEVVQTMVRLEAEVYKDTPYSEMQGCRTPRDIANYCECEEEDVRLYSDYKDGEMSFYCLCGIHSAEDSDDEFDESELEEGAWLEICDLASTNPHTPLFEVVKFISDINLPMYMDCRENTSYRIIKGLSHRGAFEILDDSPYRWGDETFHELKLRLVQGKEKGVSAIAKPIYEVYKRTM